jgi:phosphotransferase system HPr (HPr) family protein
MVQEQLIVQNETGIHARPASEFVKKANEYESEIMVVKGEKKANAKSILGLLGLAAAKGDELTIIVDGEDEQSALSAIAELINSKFGEH